MLRPMTEDEFWALVDAWSGEPGDRAAREDLLRARLLRLTPAAVAAFQAHLERAVEAAYTRPLWDAATRIEGGRCSDDGFEYFRLWLVAQGRAVYEAALAAPDTLADLSAIRALSGRPVQDWDDDEWPEWEELDYLAQSAWSEATGHEEDDFDAFFDAVDAADGIDAVGAIDALDGTDENDGVDGADGAGATAGRRGSGGERRGDKGAHLPRLAALFP